MKVSTLAAGMSAVWCRIALVGVLLGVPPATAYEWEIEGVDCPTAFWYMTDRSLRLDTQGHPHIAYGLDRLYYAWHDGQNWWYETVDDSPGVGIDASLALDASCYAHISYYDGTNGDLKYAHKDDLGWHFETVDSAEDVGRCTSLALDGSGYPHISYYDGTNGDLKYAFIEAMVSEPVQGSSLPSTLRLLSVCPNPANTHASILYALGAGAEGEDIRVSLKVYDSVGRLVAIPVEDMAGSGTQSTSWDLRFDSGRQVPSGVYYLRIEAESPGAGDVGKLVVVR